MADKNDEIRVHPLATFPVEAGEHLRALTANLLALEWGLPGEQAREVLETIFREGRQKSDDGETYG